MDGLTDEMIVLNEIIYTSKEFKYDYHPSLSNLSLIELTSSSFISSSM